MCKPLIIPSAASQVTFTDFAHDWEKEKYKNDFRSSFPHRTIKLLNKDENEIFKNFQPDYNFSRNSALSARVCSYKPEMWIIIMCQYPEKS